jgi:hypothetical protein
MGLMYKIMECGCVYSAGILHELKLIEPSISYCCQECYKTITSDMYYSTIEDLVDEIEKNEIPYLLKNGWTTSDVMKEYIRNIVGKEKIEVLWNNAKEIYEKY